MKQVVDSPRLFRVQLGGLAGARVMGITGLRWTPDAVGRIGRPAHPGKRLAAVVVRPAAAGETMRVPPMPKAATVRVPATDRTHPLEGVLRPGFRSPAIATQRLSAGGQTQHKCPDTSTASHAFHPPIRLVRHRLPGAPTVATPESLAGPELRDGPRRW